MNDEFLRRQLDAQLTGTDNVLCPLVLENVSASIVGEYLLARADRPRSAKDKNKDEPRSDSTINGWSSAIRNLFSMFNVVPPLIYTESLGKVKKGYRKDTAKHRQKNTYGKDPIPFDLLVWLADKMLQQDDFKEFSFARLFMLLQWNLMCRSANAEDVAYSHLEWKDDNLLIYFRMQKNDQDGTRSKDPRHVYANPFRPEICPILALGVWLLCCPPAEDQTVLFDGNC